MKNPSSSTVPILLVAPSRSARNLDELKTTLAAWYTQYFNQPWQEQNPHVITINEEYEGIKIDDVRKLQNLLSYSTGPNHQRIVLMYGFESTQPVAQNAMLKLLEEPPENTQFILITKNLSATLPTVRSRCVVAHLEASDTNTAQELPYQPNELLKKVTSSKTGELLTLSDELSDRETATQILEALLLHLHEQLKTKPTKQTTTQIAATQTCLNDLKANINVKLALDHCWLILTR